MKRRDFIRNSSFAITGLLTVPMISCKAAGHTNFGLALYTVRDAMNSDVKGTLTQLAAIGYESVESANYSDGKYYGIVPADFKSLLNDNGLKHVSAHLNFNKENIQTVAKDAATAGVKYVVKPWMSHKNLETKEACVKVAEELNFCGKVCADNGVKLLYHNHAFEFNKVDDTTGYDMLLENTDPSLVSMEVDLYWMVKAKQAPLEYFNKYKNRFEVLHIKDMNSEGKITEVGNGTIDFKSLIDSKDSGKKHMFIEQDNNFTVDPLTSVTTSYNNFIAL